MSRGTKNEFLTIRDPGSLMRQMLDKLRLLEAGGDRIPVDRTAMLRICLERCLSRESAAAQKKMAGDA